LTRVSSDPKHCHDLGNALRAQGRLDEAIASYRDALAGEPDFADAHVSLAATLHEQGKLAEAVASYRKALSLRPDLVAAHYNLGSALKALGQTDEAVASYRKTIVLKPDFVAAHYNLANALRDSGRPDEAIASYRKAVSLRPDFAEAYNNLGLVFQAQGRLDQAADSYRKAIAARPDFADPHNNLGTALSGLGLFSAAIASYKRALELAETPEFKTNFVRCITRGAFTSADAGIRRLVARALSEAWAGRSELTKVAGSLIKAEPEVRQCIERATSAWPGRLAAPELFGRSGLAVLVNDLLLCALLENTPVGDVALERCLVMVRQALLDVATARDGGGNVPADTLTFYCALARQCFINEYVFSCTDEEIARATSLREELVAALHSGKAVPPLWIAAVASYLPLLSCPDAETLLAQPQPEPVAALLVQQIAEPLEERRHRDAMPRLTALDAGVSSLVRQQYEENPYPRWMKLPPAGKALGFDDYLGKHLPFASFRPLAKGGDIEMLIAGCGTGLESIAAAQQFPAARILAVDLSLSSLAYAKRKTREIGMSNIEYAQADIMKLPSIGRTFDVIVSVGVLHHLADPVAGLHELLPLLRPGGFLHLGLYSERARQAVIAARAFIAARGHAPNAADIRRCREELIDTGDRFAGLIASGDFHSMSECRDLLFHVQEHRFTVPQIGDILRDARLTFVGFSVRPDIARQYAARFGDDKTQTDLDHWDRFETEFPDTFAGMYKFWVRKPDVS
jgi:tetratricopeptide (TPR) repeat protein/SAM-dependent methyltransferase